MQFAPSTAGDNFTWNVLCSPRQGFNVKIDCTPYVISISLDRKIKISKALATSCDRNNDIAPFCSLLVVQKELLNQENCRY